MDGITLSQRNSLLKSRVTFSDFSSSVPFCLCQLFLFAGDSMTKGQMPIFPSNVTCPSSPYLGLAIATRNITFTMFGAQGFRFSRQKVICALHLCQIEPVLVEVDHFVHLLKNKRAHVDERYTKLQFINLVSF